MRRVLLSLLAMIMLSFGLVALSPTQDADAFSYGRGRVTHASNSEKKWIVTSTQYNGKGHMSRVEKGHRLPESAGKIKSIWLPKGCTIVTNGWAFQTAWTKSTWVNIGKYPFVTVKMKMDCGIIKQWTG